MNNNLAANNNSYSNNNDILFNIVKQLESIVNDLNNNKQIDIIINQLNNIIIIMNNVIKDNNKIIELMKKDKNNISYNNTINKTINYNNGSYIGEVKDGLMDGKGIYYWNDGDRY